ncbi:hypothetical protein SprV_0200579500 [Sparganum proliferum]
MAARDDAHLRPQLFHQHYTPALNFIFGLSSQGITGDNRWQTPSHSSPVGVRVVISLEEEEEEEEEEEVVEEEEEDEEEEDVADVVYLNKAGSYFRLHKLGAEPDVPPLSASKNTA